MGFYYAAEKKKFEALWKKLYIQYTALGMSESAIQAMHDYDWEVFKQERVYRFHTQEMPDEYIGSEETNSTLLKKYPQLSVDFSTWWNDPCDWVEDIDNSFLAEKLKKLSRSDLELLSKYVVVGYSQTELAQQYGISQKNIRKKLQRIIKILRQGV